MPVSPTQRTLQKLRAEGWYCRVVEHYNYFTKRRHDLFEIADVLGVLGEETLAVQCTSASNVSARVKKIADSEALPKLREAGWTIQVWGWGKGSDGKWKCRVVDLS